MSGMRIRSAPTYKSARVEHYCLRSARASTPTMRRAAPPYQSSGARPAGARPSSTAPTASAAAAGSVPGLDRYVLPRIDVGNGAISRRGFRARVSRLPRVGASDCSR
jgi:hypothetical protein